MPTPTPSKSEGSRIFYVVADDPDASDANNGRFPIYQGGQNGPWRTSQQAANTMTAGDTTYVQGGTRATGRSTTHSQDLCAMEVAGMLNG
jgi:hypothetical protein